MEENVVVELCDRMLKIVDRDKVFDHIGKILEADHISDERRIVLESVLHLLDEDSAQFSERYARCVMVQDYIWEKLNTGHWKEVWRGWRDVYAVASLLRIRITIQCLRQHISKNKSNSIPSTTSKSRCDEEDCKNLEPGVKRKLSTLENSDLEQNKKLEADNELTGVEPGDNLEEVDGLDDVEKTENLGDKEKIQNAVRKMNDEEVCVVPGVVLKDVPDVVPKDVLDVLEEVVRLCDLGLLLGAPVLDNCLELLAQLVTEALSDINCDEEMIQTGDVQDDNKHFLLEDVQVNLPAGCSKLTALQKIQEPDIEDFMLNYKIPEIPVVLTGCMSNWPALSHQTRKWSVNNLIKLAGPRTVPIEIGRNYTSDHWTQKLMTMKEFAKQYLLKENSEIGYLAQHQLLDQIPGLARDISIPDLCFTGEEDDVDINVWIGPKGTVSPLHTDPKHNFLCQVTGSKYIVLYPKKCTEMMYPHPTPLLFNTSRIDLQKVNLESNPDFVSASGWHLVLSPGEMLYIPPGMWHFVKSLQTSFSVSFWWK